MNANSEVKLDRVPTGNNPETPPEFPIPSLRKFMLPNQLVMHKSFEAKSLEELDAQVNNWVHESMSIVAIPSQINRQVDDKGTHYLLSLTYIPAAVGAE